MGSAPGVTEAAASLLEADPSLAQTLGPQAVAEFGHVPILPVLAVPAGPWPPRRNAVGAGVLAVVVLDGLLRASPPPRLFGPGDVLEPWDGNVSWTACTPVRLALIGTRFTDAVRAWPSAAAKLLARANHPPREISGGGNVDERVLDLLWRIASHWGVRRDNGVRLPTAVDAFALSNLLRISERRLAAVVSLLAVRGDLLRGDGSGWVLPLAPPGPITGATRERRDDLRSRLAHAMSIAREQRLRQVGLTAWSEAQMTLSRHRRAARRD
jgi:hypothetical protein